jgi:hypothetical protein
LKFNTDFDVGVFLCRFRKNVKKKKLKKVK